MVVVVGAGARVEGGEVLDDVLDGGGSVDAVVDEVLPDGVVVVVVAAWTGPARTVSTAVKATLADRRPLARGRDRRRVWRILVGAQRSAAWRRYKRMPSLRVGVEVEATADAVTAATATLPWMDPERIALGDDRYLVLLGTSFSDADDACAYAVRRMRKSATGMGLDMHILSAEAFPTVVDLRDSNPDRMSDRHPG
ncbi:MAG: hypothetical protein NVSMB12_08290 [Acidimicrobiales bacterium]